jgi:hypothetical protein
LISANTKTEISIEAVVIRANGKREDLGMIYSSNPFKRLLIKLRRALKWHPW